ncbi:MAG: MFS transporter [Candidatus Dormiibacterota bacterium]
MSVRGGSAPAPSLLTPKILWFLLLALCSMTSFYVLSSVLPLYASASGTSAAGLTTGVMMLSTVLTEIGLTAVIARFAYRSMMALGAVLLGLPTLLLLATHALPLILAVAFARGAGLAVTVVTGTAVAADIAPVARRGEMLGIYGVAVTIPGALGQPTGVWLARQVGFAPVFLVAVVVALAAVAMAGFLPRGRGHEDAKVALFSVVRRARVGRPALVFVLTTIAVGIYSTFLPLALLHVAPGWVAAALLALNVAAAVSRWAAGRLGDRIGAIRLLVPGVVIAALGAALAVLVASPALVVAGMLLFGVGFGVLQNTTLALMFNSVGEREFGGVSGVWNAAYDSGIGIGAVGFGFLIGATGYPIGFALTAALLLLGVVPAVLERRDRAHPAR